MARFIPYQQLLEIINIIFYGVGGRNECVKKTDRFFSSLAGTFFAGILYLFL